MKSVSPAVRLMRPAAGIPLALVLFLTGAVRAEDAAGFEIRGADALKLSQSDGEAIITAAINYGRAALAYEAAGNDDKATEMNSYLYWCKKKMTLQQMDGFLKGDEQSAAAIAKRMKELEQTLAGDAQEYMKRADAFAVAHPNEHFLIAVRFYEIADRFKGTDAGLAATDRSLKALQKITAQPTGAKLPATPPNKDDYAVASDAASQAKRKNELKALDEIMRAIKSPEEARPILTGALALCDNAIAGDDFSIAEKAAVSARFLADVVKDPALSTQVRDKSAQIAALKRDFTQVQMHLQTLKNFPADSKANLAVGKYLCFVKGDWPKGLPLLASGDDPALKRLAEADIAGAQDAGNWAALGDRWWEQGQNLIGKSRRNVLNRSVCFYFRTSQSMAGLPKLKVDKRIAEYLKENPDDLFTFNLSVESTQPSDQAGKAGGEEIHAPEFGFLRGVKVQMGTYELRPTVRCVQPIFQTGKGQITGKRIGGTDGTKEYVAKPGYAVNGIVVAKGPRRLVGLKIIFQRINGVSLDPADSYESKWIGEHEPADTITTLQEPGRMAVGIKGVGGADAEGIGLLYLKTYKVDCK